jgi:hypothetical protein
MTVRTLSIPEDAIINMLKSLPEDELIGIFSRVVVKSDVSPLTRYEHEDLSESRKEFREGKTVKWADLK